MRTVTLYWTPRLPLVRGGEGDRCVACRPSASVRALREIDIEADDALHARYLERIPVIALDGEELFDYFVDEEALTRRILYREGG